MVGGYVPYFSSHQTGCSIYSDRLDLYMHLCKFRPWIMNPFFPQNSLNELYYEDYC